MRRTAAAPLRTADDVRHLGWAPVDDENLELLGVNRDASDDELNQAFRRAARAAHPDTGGDAAQFDRVQRAYDRARASRGQDVPAAGSTRSPHDMTPVRAASWPRRALRWWRQLRLTPDHTWFAAVLVLFAALAVVASAGWLSAIAVLMVPGALLSGRLEWSPLLASLGHLLFVVGGFYGLVTLVAFADSSGLDGARAVALRAATVWAFLVLVVVTYRWMTEQRRGAPWRVHLRLMRSMARQWYAAVAQATEGQYGVWMVRGVRPQSGCTRCEVVELGTGRRRDVLLAGWPPDGTYVVLDVDGMQRAWSPQGSCMAARYDHPDFEQR